MTTLGHALRDVEDTLGSAGMMDAKKIPDAGKLLAQYGAEFKKLEDEAAATSREITESAQKLN